MKNQMKCPRCSIKTKKSNQYFPFCSRKCLLADLDNWLKEKYRLRGEDLLLKNNDFKND